MLFDETLMFFGVLLVENRKFSLFSHNHMVGQLIYVRLFLVGQKNDPEFLIKIYYRMYHLLLFFICAASISLEPDKTDLALTIYNNGFAIVKDIRKLYFPEGNSTVYFTDVAKTIDAQTVTFTPKDKNVKVQIIEQNYEENLVSKQKIIKDNIQKFVKTKAVGTNSSYILKGKLLDANDDSCIIQQKQNRNVTIINWTQQQLQNLLVTQMPLSLLTKPTLTWKTFSSDSYRKYFQIAYRATDITWKTDYSMVLDDETKYGNLSAWVTIQNNSGKKYQNAKLKLIAGDVNTVTSLQKPYLIQEQASNSTVVFAPPQFVQKSFSDYHMYTLNQRSTINESSAKQLQLFKPIYNILVDKLYQFNIDGGTQNEQIIRPDVSIRFNNTQSSHQQLGIPFPAGTFRLFMIDPQDNFQLFVGESQISDTPKDQNITAEYLKSLVVLGKKTCISMNRQSDGGYQAIMKLQVFNYGTQTIQPKIIVNAPFNYNYGFGDFSINFLEKKDYNITEEKEGIFSWKRIMKPLYKYTFKWREYLSGSL